MSTENGADDRQHEAKIMAYRNQTNERLQRLLASSLSLHEIAELLDAQEFLCTQETGKGKEPVLEFNAAEFIEREVKKDLPLVLPTNFLKVKYVVLPPDEGEVIRAGSGEGVEAKKIIPRSHYLMEVLSEIDEPYAVVAGTNTATMVREESYRVFVVFNLEKIIFVNDEEGNATFVVHQVSGVQQKWPQFAKLTKSQLKELGPSKVTCINYQGDSNEWKARLKVAITTNPNPETAPKPVDKNKEKGDYKPAPPGWFTERALSLKSGFAKPTLKKVLADNNLNNPVDTQMYLDNHNTPRNHHSPRAVDVVMELAIPSHWIARNTWVKTIPHVSPNTAKARATIVAGENSAVTKKKGVVHYDAPSVIAEVREYFKNRKPARPNWKTAARASREDIGHSHTTAEPILERFAAQFVPDEHGPGKEEAQDEGGHMLIHYRPEVIRQAKEYFKAVPPAPANWKNKNTGYMYLRGRGVKISYADFVKELEERTLQNPALTEPFRDEINNVRPFYAPSLIEEIERAYTK